MCANGLMPSEICVVRPPRVCDGLENAMNVAVTCPFQLKGEQLKLDALEDREPLNSHECEIRLRPLTGSRSASSCISDDFCIASEGRRCVMHKGAIQVSMDSVLKLLLVTELNLFGGLLHPLPRTQKLAGTSA